MGKGGGVICVSGGGVLARFLSPLPSLCRALSAPPRLSAGGEEGTTVLLGGESQ